MVDFHHYVKNILKKKYSVINSLHFFKSQKIVTKCLQYERVIKIFFYFRILNIVKFG